MVLAAPLAVPRAPDRLLSATSRWSRGVLVVALLAGLAAPAAVQAAAPVLLVVAVVVGMPHGAVDHLAWSWDDAARRAPSVRVLIAYAAAAAAAVAAALLWPLPALLLLLALSAFHFAEGEVAWARLRGSSSRAVVGAASGLAVVALPLLLRPEAVRPALSALHPQLPEILLSPWVRLPVLATTLALVLMALLVARAAPVQLAELLLVVAVAAVLPPLAAFAVWFAGWHAVRHTARLVHLDPGSTGDLAAGRLRAPLRRFAAAAALPTAAALLGALALAAFVGLTGGLVIALLALTVPHTAVVARLSRQPARAR